jgi:hypothetical protein
MTDDELRTDLLVRIELRRSEVRAFLRQRRPRSRRRANATLVFTSLAAVFTIGPAAGGESFSGGVQKALGLASDSYVWRVLCLLTVVVSAAAAVLTNVSKTHDDSAQLAAAQAADAELEGLATLLRYGHLSLDDAAKLYQQYTATIGFVDEVEPATAVPGPVRPAPVAGLRAPSPDDGAADPETQSIRLPVPPRTGTDGRRRSAGRGDRGR